MKTVRSHCSCMMVYALVLAATGFLAGAQQPAPSAGLRQFNYAQPKMGTIFQLILWAPDQKSADDAAEVAWHRIDQLNKTLSDYDPESELNQLCRRTDQGPMAEPVRVSDDLYEILEDSIEAARLSDGAFDITVGPLTRLQRQARKTCKLPDQTELKQAMQRIGWRYLRLIPEGHRAQILHEKMQLDVGGIAKGFTSDKVIALLREKGITRALCGAAGDIATGDPPPGRPDWRIAIQSLADPEHVSDYVRIHSYGISTSGDTYRSAIVDGKRYSHIIDPRTGLGLTHRIGVTTVAPTGVAADWTATAISVLGPEKGLEMIERLDGAAARVVTLDENEKEKEKVYESQKFPRFLLIGPATSGAAPPPVH